MLELPETIEGHTLTLDGSEVSFAEGETVLQVAEREGKTIPTLCHDPRLEPVGVCRTCLVEIDGWYDVDDGRALERLRRDLASDARDPRAPETARFLASCPAG